MSNSARKKAKMSYLIEEYIRRHIREPQLHRRRPLPPYYDPLTVKEQKWRLLAEAKCSDDPEGRRIASKKAQEAFCAFRETDGQDLLPSTRERSR